MWEATLLEGLENYPCHSKSHKNVWGARRLFFESQVPFKRNLALLMDQCAAHSDVGLSLQCMRASSTCCQTPPVHATAVTKCHLPYETSILQACSTLLWEVDRNFLMEDKVECCECHMRCSHGMEICHARSNSELLHSIFRQCCEDEQNCEWVQLQGHNDCPSTFMKFLNVAKSVPATGDLLTSLGSPSTGFVHVIDERVQSTHGHFLPNPPAKML